MWQLTSGPLPDCDTDALVRSSCQAGYKACWNAETGFPSPQFFAAADTNPGECGRAEQNAGPNWPRQGAEPGRLTAAAMADSPRSKSAGTPVATATIDAHAGVPGAGASGRRHAGHGARHQQLPHAQQPPPSTWFPASPVWSRDGILPGAFGYETGQASVGDALAWVSRTTGNESHEELNARSPRSYLAGQWRACWPIDWLNGCRTPLMDGRLSGAFLGLTLGTRHRNSSTAP